MADNLCVDDIKSILDSGKLDDFLGAVESQLFECKGAPYQLKHNLEKQELAKDVSSFANAEGGIILIGATTEINTSHLGEEITDIRPFKQSLIDQNQYYNILKDWIYPTLQHVDISWYPSSDDPERGIIAIHIPKQTRIKLPFLVTRTVEETGKLNAIIFGYFERKRARIDSMTVEELHSTLSYGLIHETVGKQYESLQETLSQIIIEGNQKTNLDVSKQVSERITEALTESGLHSKPAFILSAIPTEPLEIKKLFESRESDIVKLIENPPQIRSGGFDLKTYATARIVRGQLRRAVTIGNSNLELWRDGALIFVATGDVDFLSWGRYYKAGGPFRINPLTLIESSYLFIELNRLIYSSHSNKKPKQIKYGLDLLNMSVNNIPCSLNIKEAPDSNASFSITSDDLKLSPGRVAFLLVREVYRWFGIEDDKIPYTEQINNNIEISPNIIKNIAT